MKRWPTFIPLLFVTLQAAAQTADMPGEAPPVAALSAEYKSMQLLAKFQDPSAVIWLEANGEKFLSLYRPALAGKAKGTMVLLHAEGQHAAWPGPLSYLRNRLPELGWNTLSITLPELAAKLSEPESFSAPPPSEVLDETEEIFDPTTDTVSDGTVIPSKKKSMANDIASEANAVERIVAAVDYLKNQQQSTIVLYGQGLGALRGSRYWHETGDNAIKAFIFVDGQNALGNSEFKLPDALNNPRLPVLDIIYSRALPAELDAKQRAEKAAMMELQAYQQHWFAEDNERLANMVYGFLRRTVSQR